MEDRLRITVSGIRGKVPGSLNVDITSRFASAFASYLEQGSLILGRDNRITSQMLAMAALSSSMAAGLDIQDYGLLPTPFLQFLLARNQAAGGISVSGGHNPLPWNAVILLGETGTYLEENEGAEVFNVYEAGSFQKAAWNRLGKVTTASFPLDDYMHTLSNQVDAGLIQKSKFKVVADPCNGAVSPFLKQFGDNFGIEMIIINDDPEKPFPHQPEPSPDNSAQVEAVVKATGSDLGILFNSDGSRLSLVTEKGKGLSEELTLPLSILSLQGRIRQVVSTVATSSWVDWAGKQAGVKIRRTRVGQSAVSQVMQAEEASLGGEGSGSLAFLPVSPGYDALTAFILILQLLAIREEPLSEIAGAFPELHRRKLKIPVSPVRVYGLMDRLEEMYAPEKPDTTDGIRVDRGSLWFIIRPSSTEFILRIMIEGKDEDEVEAAENEIRERVEP
jgi:phosphomannomutase